MMNFFKSKKNVSYLLVLLFYAQTSYAQLFSFSSKEEPKMGLMDVNLSIGNMSQFSNKTSTGLVPSDKNISTQFIYFHFEESMLSNWWNADENTRFLFGIRENLDLGLGKTTTTEKFAGVAEETSSEYGLLFSYDGGIGGVYRINKKMDVGLNYYFLSISSFNKNSDKNNYPKFRFRYDKYLAELSVKARTTFEFKYLTDGEDGFSSYFGLSYSYWNRGNEPAHIVEFDTNIFQLSVGLQL